MRSKVVFLITVLVVGVSLLLSACSSAAQTSTPSSPSTTAPSTTAAGTPSTTASGTTTTAPKANAIKLTAVSFMAKNITTTHFMGVYADEVAKASNGQVTIDWLGGPEVFPFPQGQIDAIKTDKVDLLQMPFNVLLPSMPLLNSEYTPVEERQNGIYAWADQQFREKTGTHYLGRLVYNQPAALFTNFDVTSYKDIAGHNMGGLTWMVDLLKNLGANPVKVQKTDWYTDVQSKVIDGYGQVVTSIVSLSLQDVTKYMIDYTFSNDGNNGLFINLNKYNSLPPNVQKILDDTAASMEPEVADYFAQQLQSSRAKMQAAGMKFIELPSGDASSFKDLVNQSMWEEFKGTMSADELAKDQAMLTKK